MHSDHSQKEWREEIDARLDVCAPTKKGYSEREKVRFDIAWSAKAKQYCMYVSLPTSARSISLSLKRFESEKDLMAEVGSWLAKAGCKRVKRIEVKGAEVKKIEQMTLF